MIARFQLLIRHPRESGGPGETTRSDQRLSSNQHPAICRYPGRRPRLRFAFPPGACYRSLARETTGPSKPHPHACRGRHRHHVRMERRHNTRAGSVPERRYPNDRHAVRTDNRGRNPDSAADVDFLVTWVFLLKTYAPRVGALRPRLLGIILQTPRPSHASVITQSPATCRSTRPPARSLPDAPAGAAAPRGRSARSGS